MVTAIQRIIAALTAWVVLIAAGSGEFGVYVLHSLFPATSGGGAALLGFTFIVTIAAFLLFVRSELICLAISWVVFVIGWMPMMGVIAEWIALGR